MIVSKSGCPMSMTVNICLGRTNWSYSSTTHLVIPFLVLRSLTVEACRKWAEYEVCMNKFFLYSLLRVWLIQFLFVPIYSPIMIDFNLGLNPNKLFIFWSCFTWDVLSTGKMSRSEIIGSLLKVWLPLSHLVYHLERGSYLLIS